MTVQSEAASSTRRETLRRNRDFMNLWISESISQIGSHVSLVALPLLAVLSLDASPAQMGFLSAAGTAPVLLIGLFVGVWVDRVRRRPLMVVADLARGLFLLTVPVAWWFGVLRIEMLYAVALLTGALTVIFDVAWQTYLPSIVPRNRLVDANSKLHLSASVAQVSGPGAGGLLVGLAGAPIAILLDALSFFASAGFIARTSPERADQTVNASRNVFREIADGLSFVYRESVLRAIVYSKVIQAFSGGMFFAVYVLFLADDLALGAAAIGVVLALGGIGSLGGASLAGWLGGRVSEGRAVVGGQFFFGVFGATIPLAVLFPSVALAMIVLSELLQWMTYVVAQINEVSIRQSIAPDTHLGRVHSVFQFFGRGMTPLGAIAGGILGEFVGVPATLVVASVGFFAAFLFVAFSPVRGYISPGDTV